MRINIAGVKDHTSQGIFIIARALIGVGSRFRRASPIPAACLRSRDDVSLVVRLASDLVVIDAGAKRYGRSFILIGCLTQKVVGSRRIMFLILIDNLN